nr:LysR substrate-binding domain-containing protein [Lentzea jiangxiensis]
MGISPLIGSDLVARAISAARDLSRARNLVLRESDLGALRMALKAGQQDLLLMPAIEAMLTYHHLTILREPMVVVDPAAPIGADQPLKLAAAKIDYILVSDTCGLTRFTTRLFYDNHIALRTYPGEAANYRVLDE